MEAGEAIDLLRFAGFDISYSRRAAGGEVGAHIGVLADGRRVVFKVAAVEDLPQVQAAVAHTARLRAVGYPIPHHHDPVVGSGGVVIVQDFVEGTWSDLVDDQLVADVVRLNHLQSGLGAGLDPRVWMALMRRSLTEGMDGWCRHEPLESFSADSLSLLGMVRRVGSSLPQLPAGDLVHLDLHHRNILRFSSHLSAVIDWEGCQGGDRNFDLVTFAFGLTVAEVSEEARASIWSLLHDSVSPEVLDVYVAHMALRLVDWNIRFHAGEEVDSYVEVARAHLGV